MMDLLETVIITDVRPASISPTQETLEDKTYLDEMREGRHEASGEYNFDGMVCKHCGATSRVPGWSVKCFQSQKNAT